MTTINITPQITAAYESYLNEAVDADFHGRTILRRQTAPFSTGLHIGIVDFAAGFQMGREHGRGDTTMAPAIPNEVHAALRAEGLTLARTEHGMRVIKAVTGIAA